MPDLSILCVTKGERCVLPLLELLSLASRMVGAEFVLVADGQKALDTVKSLSPVDEACWLFKTKTKGYIESVLDLCINLTTGRYVFRVDDDESIPPPLIEWLRAGEYKKADHWKFNRAHLIRKSQHVASWDGKVLSSGPAGLGGFYEDEIATSPPLWPDHQTRLSTRKKSLGRTYIHCGSPHGGGELAPYPILHHKFVIKSLEEREEILKRYDEIQPGAGAGFWQFSVPERGTVETISYAEFVRRGYTV